MPIPVKIECGCGQRYAFEVEPVGGRLPSSVACPVCGADGTAAANAIVARQTPAQAPLPVATLVGAGPRLQVAPPAPPPPPPSPPVPSVAASPGPAIAPAARVPHRPSVPGQIDRAQAVVEARAEILWGDPPQEVIKYLMMQGVPYEEASVLVNDMFRERAATFRSLGLKKIIIGGCLMAVPVVTYLIFLSMGVIFVKILGAALAAGLYGVYLVVRGSVMLISPKSESGDLADQ